MRDRRKSDAANLGVSLLFEVLFNDFHCGPVTVMTSDTGVVLTIDAQRFEDRSLEGALVKTVDHLTQQHPDTEIRTVAR